MENNLVENLDIRQYITYADKEKIIFKFPSTLTPNFGSLAQRFKGKPFIKGAEFKPFQNEITLFLWPTLNFDYSVFGNEQPKQLKN